MNVIPLTFDYRVKPLNIGFRTVLQKEIFCVRVDYQLAYVDYHPFRTYATVATNEAGCILLPHAEYNYIIVEGGDVVNAYLYGPIYLEVYIKHRTVSSGIEEITGKVFLLAK